MASETFSFSLFCWKVELRVTFYCCNYREEVARILQYTQVVDWVVVVTQVVVVVQDHTTESELVVIFWFLLHNKF